MRMRRLPFRACWGRLSLLTWITLWLLALPFVHIHPDAGPHHGGLHHVHATVHTVFSPDRLSEDAAHLPHTHSFNGQDSSQADAEIGFLVAFSEDRDAGKLSSDTVGGEGPRVIFRAGSYLVFFETPSPSFLLASALSSGGPPFPFV